MTLLIVQTADYGVIHERRRNILRGKESLKFLCFKMLEREILGKSGLKFRHEGRKYQKWPQKFRRLLWTAPNLD